jgi:hypothetical protein
MILGFFPIMPQQEHDHSLHRIEAEEQNLARQKHARLCVARVIVAGQEDGTGILLPDNWFLTCHHVMRSRESAARPTTTAQFGYAMRTDGVITDAVQLHFDPSTFHTSAEDDWTLIKVLPNPKRGLASLLGQGGLHLEHLQPEKGAKVYLIHHPAAEVQKTSSGHLMDVNDARLHHDAITEGGSSGAPIFDSQWRMVGIHRGRLGTGEKEGIHLQVIIAGIKAANCWPLKSASLPLNHRSGPLPVDDPWYIQRPSDGNALSFIQGNGVSMVLIGNALSGKSSMAVRLIEKLKSQGLKTVEIDVRNGFKPAHFGSTSEFFRRVAQLIVRELGDSQNAFEALPLDGTATDFATFLDLHHRHSGYQYVVVFDHLDALAGKDCCSDVLSGLRLVDEEQSALPAPWLRQILVVTVKPRAKNANFSPLDVLYEVNIGDFSLEELHQLIAKFSLSALDAQDIHRFLGGQPYLTRMALNHLQLNNMSWDTLRAATVSKNGSGVISQHLNKIRQRISSPALKGFRSLLNQKSLPPEVFEELSALGLINGFSAEDATPRCELYHHI